MGLRKHVKNGFAAFWRSKEVARGSGALHSDTHVFDGEAVGALRAYMGGYQQVQGLIIFTYSLTVYHG